VSTVNTVLISGAADLDAAAILAVARGAGIELGAALLGAVGDRRAEVLAALDGRAVYGITTGMGAQSKVGLTEVEQSQHQNNLLLARAVGGPPWLPAEEVRALFAVRLRNFLTGDAGVSPELLLLLTRFLDAGVVPAVPTSGSGSAGEIIPLAHAFGPLTGVGSVLTGARSGLTGAGSGLTGAGSGLTGAGPGLTGAGPGTDPSVREAADVLVEQGLTAMELGPKEGVALLQGVPGTTAQAILIADRTRRLIQWWQAVLAIGIVAASAPQDVYLPSLARGDPELTAVLAALQVLLADSDASSRSLQAPVSFRVAGPVLAHLQRSVSALSAAVERALVGVTDSPAFVDGDFHATAGFHGLDLAAHLDAVSVALVHAAEVSAARTHRLLDTAVTGLPPQLASRSGPDTGLIAVHKRAAAAVHQLRRAAAPSIVGSMETSFGQEDVQTFSWEAAANARTALDGALEVMACELLTAYHATVLGGRSTGPALRAILDSVATVVPPIHRDRPFGRDIEALRLLLGDRPRP
jgi:histidine ammonia-lyase